ncbi:hypothetical protein BATMR_16160 [Bacillus altitudinis]|uniref:DUF2750 domain-containing protein n=1 Tax=Bacillus altitudinis TaxID=293387 RepID=UPI001CFD3098|nr:DUF2750 domain-containing protein [Bacillus altitudinis]GJI58588.1 hypothetical protein BATMR_16160 [Bacillus altitudinis]
MSMHPKELETTMQLPAKKCYDYFIKKIVDFEEVWSLRNEKGRVMSEDDYRVPQLHFWPTEDHAAYCAIDQWEKTVIKRRYRGRIKKLLVRQEWR